MALFEGLITRCNSQTILSKGEVIYERDRVKIDDVFMNKRNNLVVKATVEGDTDFYNVELQSGKFLTASCDCKYFKSYQIVCKHIVATALQANETLDDNSAEVYEKKQMEKIVYNLNEDLHFTYEKLIQKQSQEEHKSYSLIPLLSNNYHLIIKFKYGTDKKFTVKHLRNFFASFDYKETQVYGKNTVLEHNADYLEENCKTDFFMAKGIIDSMDSNYNSYYSSLKNNNCLEFSGVIADHFFDSILNYQQSPSYSEKEIVVVNEKIKLNFYFDKSNTYNDLYILKLENDIKFYDGAKHSYALNNKKYLYRIDIDDKNLLIPLINMSLSDGFLVNNSNLFNKETITSFIRNVAPLVSKVASFEVDKELQDNIKLIPLNAKLYLDVENDAITADLKCFYGDTEVNIFNADYIRKKSGDFFEESKLKASLRKYFTTYDGNFVITNEDKQYEFLTIGLANIEKQAEIYASDAFNKFSVSRPPQLNVGIKLNGDLLNLNVSFNEEYTTEQMLEVLKAIKNKKKYHRVSANKFINLENASYPLLDDLADSENLGIKEILNKDVSINKYRALHLDEVLKSSGVNYNRDKYFKTLINDISNFKDSDVSLPNQFENILRHYQKLGYRWFKALSHYKLGGILADDMGLGKSIQSIAFLSQIKGNKLIVCPSSLILNWQKEFAKFDSSAVAITLFGSKKERQNIIKSIKDNQTVITSYELLKKDIEQLKELEFSCTILDEGQYIKNHSTLNSKAVKQINSKLKFILTGTPIENNLAELWSLFDFIMPGYLYNYNKFKSTFEKDIMQGDDESTTKKLHAMVSPFILRRLKKDVLKELPEKIDNPVSIPLIDEQRKLYASFATNIKNNIASMDSYNNNKLMVLSYLTKLRQICCSPNLIDENYKGNDEKLTACMDIILSAKENKHKVLLFSQFTSMLDIIRKKLESLNISYYLLQGDTKREDRMAMVDKFNEDDTEVFLLSLKAGGTGLNLTSASVVIHYDPWWNLSVQNQATDRAHRIGQTKAVQVYRLIVKDTIEEKIVNLQDKKQDLFDKVIVDGKVDFAKMSKDDILQLLSM